MCELQWSGNGEVFLCSCCRCAACCMIWASDWQVWSTNQRCCSLPVCCFFLSCVVCVCVCRFRRLDLHLLPDCSRFTPLNLLETIPNSSSSSAPCLRTRDVFRELQGSAVHTESFNHCNTLPVFNAATRPLFSPHFRFKFFLDSILMFKWNCSKSKIMSSLLESWGLYKFNCNLLKD